MQENPLRVMAFVIGIMFVGFGVLFLGDDFAFDAASMPVIGVSLLAIGGLVFWLGFSLPGRRDDDDAFAGSETISDGYIGGFLPGSPVPVEAHAHAAAHNADHASKLFHLTVMDVGLEATDAATKQAYTFLTAPLPLGLAAVYPFTVIYAQYPQRGALELRLFNDAAEEQSNYHEVIDLQRAGPMRIVGEAVTLPPAPVGEWALGVYFNDTLIALHPVYWAEA